MVSPKEFLAALPQPPPEDMPFSDLTPEEQDARKQYQLDYSRIIWNAVRATGGRSGPYGVEWRARGRIYRPGEQPSPEPTPIRGKRKTNVVWWGYVYERSDHDEKSLVVAMYAGSIALPEPYSNRAQERITLYTKREFDAFVEGAKDAEFDLDPNALASTGDAAPQATEPPAVE